MDNKFGKYEIVEPWLVSEQKKVPSYIPKPSYADTAVPTESVQRAEIKDTNQIECMRQSCNLAKTILQKVSTLIKVSTTLIIN